MNELSRPTDVLPPFSVDEVLVAGDKGPCPGVNMAIDTTQEVLRLVAGRETVYANNPPVHNDLILEEFQSQGLKIEPNLDNIPKGAILILSAHGTRPSIDNALRERGMLVVNTECPLVRRNRKHVEKVVVLGEIPLYIGVEGHPETTATIGDCREKVVFLAEGQDPKTIDFPEGGKITILNQTTLSSKATRNTAKALRDSHPDRTIEGPSGICNATDYRQTAAYDLFSVPEKPIDFLLVVGSKQSHNSKELRGIGEELLGEDNAKLIDGPEEIDPSWFIGKKRIGFTAGASVMAMYSDPVLNWFAKRGTILTFLPRKEQVQTFKRPTADIEAVRTYIQEKYAQ